MSKYKQSNAGQILHANIVNIDQDTANDVQ